VRSRPLRCRIQRAGRSWTSLFQHLVGRPGLLRRRAVNRAGRSNLKGQISDATRSRPRNAWRHRHQLVDQRASSSWLRYPRMPDRESGTGERLNRPTIGAPSSDRIADDSWCRSGGPMVFVDDAAEDCQSSRNCCTLLSTKNPPDEVPELDKLALRGGPSTPTRPRGPTDQAGTRRGFGGTRRC
jgi:hypothetical protein